MLAIPAGYAGAAIAALCAAHQMGRIYSSAEPFGPELMNVARNLGIFILPALVLLWLGLSGCGSTDLRRCTPLCSEPVSSTSMCRTMRWLPVCR